MDLIAGAFAGWDYSGSRRCCQDGFTWFFQGWMWAGNTSDKKESNRGDFTYVICCWKHSCCLQLRMLFTEESLWSCNFVVIFFHAVVVSMLKYLISPQKSKAQDQYLKRKKIKSRFMIYILFLFREELQLYMQPIFLTDWKHGLHIWHTSKMVSWGGLRS